MSLARRSAFLRRFAILLLVIGALHFYLGTRLFGGGWLSPPAAGAGWTLLALAFVSVPLGFLGMIFPRPRALGLLRRSGHFWLGGFFVLLSFALLIDLAIGAARLVGIDPPPPAARGAVVTIGGALLVLLAILNGRLAPRVVRREVRLRGLGRGLDGFRLLQISDVHLGQAGTGRVFLERLVERMIALRPDAIAITGDLVEGSYEALRPILGPLRLLRAPHGVFCVTGNHEYYHGGKEWEAELARLGFTVLDNEHRIVERDGARVAIGGIPDATATYFDPTRVSRPELAFQGAPDGVPRVLLAHQPRVVAAAAAAGVQLQLSGHTHGGQIVPFNLLVRLQQPVAAGLRRRCGVWVYAHPGTGYWGPRMRLGTRAEIAEIVLRPAD